MFAISRAHAPVADLVVSQTDILNVGAGEALGQKLIDGLGAIVPSLEDAGWPDPNHAMTGSVDVLDRPFDGWLEMRNRCSTVVQPQAEQGNGPFGNASQLAAEVMTAHAETGARGAPQADDAGHGVANAIADHDARIGFCGRRHTAARQHQQG